MGMGDKFKDMAEDIADKAGDLADKAKDVAEDLGDKAGDLAEKAKDAAEDLGDKAKDTFERITGKDDADVEAKVDEAKSEL